MPQLSAPDSQMQQRAEVPEELVRASGALAALGPLLSLVGPLIDPNWISLGLSHDWRRAAPIWALWTASVAMTVGGASLPWKPGSARPLVTLSAALAAAIGTWLSGTNPLTALFLVATCIGLVHWMWPTRPVPASRHLLPAVSYARGSAVVVIVAVAVVILTEHHLDFGTLVAFQVSSAISTIFLVRAAFAVRRAQPMLFWLVWLAVGVVLISASMLHTGRVGWRGVLLLGSAPSFVTLLGLRKPGPGSPLLTSLIDGVASHPARLLSVTFLALCALGTLLMRLPAASAGGALPAVDAAFTATSAVCVTGLIVVDTATALSPVGHVLLLVLIQIGGLGIMSFSTVIAAALGRRLSLRHEAAMADLLLSENRGELNQTLKHLLGVTFLTELAGAVCLWPLFMREGDGVWSALWRAVFTSVSAFCNAGFGLQSASLVPYAHSAPILNVVALLIIIGGLSPLVVLEIPRALRRQSVSVQTRMALVTSATLLVSATLIVGSLEWSHSLGQLSLWERLNGAWFQAVSLRTAGFNSVDFAQLRPATLWVMCVFMFIGGSPGGTAGGVKTTTAAVLMVAVYGAMRGRWETVAFGRRIAHKTVYKAAAIVTVALCFIVVGVTALSVTQEIEFASTLFEVVSALGTVGLSAGATAQLDDVGKVVVMALMFIGRIGPLTLFLFLSERHAAAAWEVPEEDVDVG